LDHPGRENEAARIRPCKAPSGPVE
jgi:hypothetical protein